MSEQSGLMHVVGGQIGQRSTPVVLVLHAHKPGQAGRQVGWQRQRAWMLVFSSELITNSRLVNGFPSKKRA